MMRQRSGASRELGLADLCNGQAPGSPKGGGVFTAGSATLTQVNPEHIFLNSTRCSLLRNAQLTLDQSPSWTADANAQFGAGFRIWRTHDPQS